MVENVWCLRRPSYLTCSYVVETVAGYVFIDAGMGSDGRDATRALTEFPPRPVLAVLPTHWHNDHSAGALYLAEKHAAAVFAHAHEGTKLTRAVVRGEVRRMARHVTEDHEEALAALGASTLCPGHRYPLAEAGRAMERFARTLNEPWPLFG